MTPSDGDHVHGSTTTMGLFFRMTEYDQELVSLGSCCMIPPQLRLWEVENGPCINDVTWDHRVLGTHLDQVLPEILDHL